MAQNQCYRHQHRDGPHRKYPKMASVAIVSVQEVQNEFCISNPFIYCTFLLHSKGGDTIQQVNIAGTVTLLVNCRHCVHKRENPKETGGYIRRPNWAHENCIKVD